MTESFLRAGLLFGQQTPAATTETAEVAESARIEWARLWDLMASVDGRLVLAVLLATFGLWMMLPGPRRRLRILGGLLTVFAALLTLSIAPLVGAIQIPFTLLSGLTLVSAVSAVTARNPVYAAIWFALMLLGVGGLFLINGAQFLGVATVAVYAGAIVVTFLFVLMLAQPEGHAFYDRVGWGKISQFLGCLAGMMVAGAVIWAVSEPGAIAEVVTREVRVVDNPQHVASLGGQLFTRHLAAVQAAGALLLAALVAAVAMASHGTGSRGLDERISATQTGDPVGANR